MKMSKLVLRKFYSYLLSNLIMLLLLCLVITPIGFSYHNSMIRTTLAREQELLDSSVRRLNNELITMESLMSNICSSAQLRLLSVQPKVESKHILTLNDLRGNLSALCSANDLWVEIAVLYENSDTVITSKGRFTTLSNASGIERFQDFYHLDEQTSAYFRESNEQVQLAFLEGLTLDIPQVYTYPREIAFIYSININTAPATRAFLFISQEGIDQLFSTLAGSVSIFDYHKNPLSKADNGL